jgi:hypothetical protein
MVIHLAISFKIKITGQISRLLHIRRYRKDARLHCDGAWDQANGQQQQLTDPSPNTYFQNMPADVPRGASMLSRAPVQAVSQLPFFINTKKPYLLTTYPFF